MKLFLDIETLATDRPDVAESIAANITHPAVMTKADTIAKWEAEQKPTAIAEALAKTALDGSFGRVCVIGWSVDGEPVQTVYSATDEAAVLRDFAEQLAVPRIAIFDTSVVGHNVSAFDLRFLLQRYTVHGIKPPFVIRRAAQARAWEADKVFDTMVQWAGVGNRVSLGKLCLALNIPSPKGGDITGATVGRAVAEGRITEVAEYCARDVAAVIAVWQRLTFHEVEAA